MFKSRIIMKKLAIVIIGFTFFLSNCKNGSQTVFDIRFQNVREKVISLVYDGKIASISIAVAKDGKIIWEEAFGYSNIEKKVRATSHTKYLSASIAKTFTATGLMTLSEKGLVDIDRPVLDYLPDIKIRSFVGDEREITIRHILNHRSGMPSYCELFFEDENEKPRDFRETARRYCIITFTPGSSYIYSNLGYELIGYLISEVSGASYSRFMEEEVFLPLKLTETKVFERGLSIDHSAICYSPDFKPIPNYVGPYLGADGIYFSAHDLIRFAMFHLKDHLKDQHSILTDETIDKMQEDYPPSNTRYGIGWNLDVNEAGYRSVHHGGEAPGSDNFMRLIPSEDIALVILCNNEIGDNLYEIQDEICNALIPGFTKPKIEDQQTNESGAEQQIPEELLGKWKGKIVAYDREIEVELIVDGIEETNIILSGQKENKIDLSVVTNNFLLGYFSGVIPTQDGLRYPDKIRLALIRQGDRLSGSATADQWIEERQMRYELSSWIEFIRN
jgi:CubicO group peptidase (beta-lactamase class C family)